jgi:hypothetical protein
MDERAFNARATIDSGGQIIFSKPPTAASLRHLARLPGNVAVGLRWSGETDPAASFRGHDLHYVGLIWIRVGLNVGALLKELGRPDTGLTALARLGLYGTQVTDVGMNELARPDAGLKALTDLDLRDFDQLGQPLNQSKVTDAGIEALKKARPGLAVTK